MKKICVAMAWLLAMLMLASFIATPCAALTDSGAPLDYSSPSDDYKVTLSPSDLLALLTGENISEAEARYADTYSSCSLIYSDSVPSEKVSTRYNNGTLAVTAEIYSYTAANSVTVVWTPESATIYNVTSQLIHDGNGLYTCNIGLPEEAESAFITVKYRCTIEIPYDSVNQLLNFAYNDVCEAAVAKTQYESEQTSYLEKFEQYENYLTNLNTYNTELEQFREYKEKKEQYDLDYRAYTDYLLALTDYNTKKAAYEQYLSDLEKYKVDKEAYEKAYNEKKDAYNEYVAYLGKLSVVENSLFVMDNIYETPISGRGSLFRALQNKELVSQFENNKSTLVKIYRIDENLIDSLTVVSEELNALLIEYDSIRKESRQASFEFYKAHYTEIRDKFNYLYDSMTSIMNGTIFNHICAKIDYTYDAEQKVYKKFRILNVLSHIYLVCKALDDSETALGSWTFYDFQGNINTYYFTDLLDAKERLIDTNASSPENISWPEEVPQPEMPVMPIAPTPVTEPLAPTEVAEPTAPMPVVTEPVMPPYVASPGNPPAVPPIVMRTEEIKCENLSPRAELTENAQLSFETDISKLVSCRNMPVLRVYDYDGKTVLYECELASESDFILPPTPLRASDDRYDYTFKAWSSEKDSVVTPVYIPERDINVYAVYNRSDREYTVSWNVGGNITTQTYKYGETPFFDGNTSVPPENDTVYIFSGWYPELSHVRKDIEYTAQYTQSVRHYTVEWDIRGVRTTQYYRYGETPIPPTFSLCIIDNCLKYDFTGWDSQPSNVNADICYTSQWSRTVLAHSEIPLTLSATSGGYMLACDTQNTEIEINIGNILEYCVDNGKRLEIAAGGVVVSFDKAAADTLRRLNTTEFLLELPKAERQGYIFTLLDANGSRVSVYDGNIRMSLPYSGTSLTNLYISALYEGNSRRNILYSVKSGSVSFVASAGTEYIFDMKYNITFTPCEHGAVFSDVTVLRAGSTLSALFYPTSDFELADIAITLASDGSVIHLTSLAGFVMPESDISVTVTYRQIEYTVKFVINGEIISEKFYHLGDVVEIPEVFQSYEDGGYVYTFEGWSPLVTTVTGDVTYSAKISCQLVGNTGSQGNTNAWKAIIVQFVLPAIALLLTICFSVLVITFFRKSHPRKVKNDKKLS